MTFLKAALVVAAVTALPGHVAPSVDDNNRYLKLTPLRGGVRLAYTVFFGEIPGASERRKLDENRDGRVDDAEASRFATKLGAEVAAAIELEADGAPRRVRWSLVTPGMGSDAVAAGSFSVDLVTFVCLPARSRHHIRLRDQFRIPKPGETEVRVEDSPGVTIHRARVGPADDPDHNFRFAGPGGPLSDDGLDLEYSVTDKTPALPQGTCAAAASPASGSSGTAIVLGAVIIALAIAGGVFVWRRRKLSTAS
jgi:hypothetical protein